MVASTLTIPTLPILLRLLLFFSVVPVLALAIEFASRKAWLEYARVNGFLHTFQSPKEEVSKCLKRLTSSMHLLFPRRDAALSHLSWQVSASPRAARQPLLASSRHPASLRLRPALKDHHHHHHGQHGRGVLDPKLTRMPRGLGAMRFPLRILVLRLWTNPATGEPSVRVKGFSAFSRSWTMTRGRVTAAGVFTARRSASAAALRTSTRCLRGVFGSSSGSCGPGRGALKRRTTCS